MGRLYVISGVTGMTGNELARQLLERGETVIGFDNFFASSDESISDLQSCGRLHFSPYDLNDPRQMSSIAALVRQLQETLGPAAYINCAAVVHTEYFYHVEDTFTTNVLGMRQFLAQALAVGAKAFINCSTSEVYSLGADSEDGVDEASYLRLATAEHSQRTSYAAGKLLTEFFLKDAVDSGCIDGCSIRFANVYSKNERYAKHIIPHIIRSLEERGVVTLLENAKTTRRTFLHNRDSCGAVLALMDHEAALDGTIYNVATQEEVTILELVERIAQKLGRENPVIEFSGSRTADPQRRLLSTQKLAQRTGWTPRISLSQGLDMAIAHWRGERE